MTTILPGRGRPGPHVMPWRHHDDRTTPPQGAVRRGTDHRSARVHARARHDGHCRRRPRPRGRRAQGAHLHQDDPVPAHRGDHAGHPGARGRVRRRRHRVRPHGGLVRLQRRGPRAVRRPRHVPDVGRPLERRREGRARALPAGGRRHRRHPQRDRHARRLPVVGRHDRRADARSRRHGQQPGPAGDGPRRGPHAPVDRAPAAALDARGRVVQLLGERPWERSRAGHDGRDHVRPGRQQDGLRPPHLVVPRVRRRPGLDDGHGPLRGALHRRARLRAARRRRRAVGRGPGRGRLRRHRLGLVREGRARHEHERAVRHGRRARRPRVLHRAGARPDPRLRPAHAEHHDRHHHPRVLGRRGRPAGDRAGQGLRGERVPVPVLLAREPGRLRPGELLQPRLAFHGHLRRTRRDGHRPGLGEGAPGDPGRAPARRAGAHGWRPPRRPRDR